MANEVFDRPPELGEVVWSVGWKERSELVGRVLFALFAGVIGSYAFAHFVLHANEHDRIEPVLGLPGLAVAAIVFVLLGPDRYCMVLGKKGFTISRKQLGFRITRRMVEFAEADDVEVTYTRIVSDGVSQLYTRTDVAFVFLDREGYELERIDGTIDEPAQRAAGKWDPTAPVDLSNPRARDRNAQLGYAAVDWFHAFKDQRDATPYR